MSAPHVSKNGKTEDLANLGSPRLTENDGLAVVDNNADARFLRNEHSSFPSRNILPSELLESYGALLPPPSMYGENLASPTEPFVLAGGVEASLQSQADCPTTPSYAEFANNLVNERLGRTPSGGSVVEPNSVLGESGRLYHGYKDGKYFLPNDAAEQDRLDLQHEIYSQVLDGWLSIAPIKNIPKYVLDIGTGTGLWAAEFAEQNPSSYVIGIDLSTIQPTPRFPNLEFLKADAEDDWIFPEPHPDHSSCFKRGECFHPITFDYVHLRMMFTCFNNPLTVMRHAFQHLSPGGWVEFQESRLKVYQANPEFKDDAIQRWADGCILGAAKMGRDVECVLKYEDWLRDAGFINITKRVFLVPMGDWHPEPKLNKIGFYMLQNTLQSIPIVWKMLQQAGMTAAEIEALIQQTQHEAQDRQNFSYCLYYTFTAQKPLGN
ncbi:S-adenosyl-L-methionine-dependent methyltransferase [Xylariales sp. PMI_506]|nr:S-adenosyl-L-methionine-dependent methyltransferase [Xylariales sp. PMI_506]